MKKVYITIFVFLIILSFRTYALVRPDSNPWLLESVTLKTNLPIKVEKILRASGRDGSFSVVVNSSTTPIFFARKHPGYSKLYGVPYSYPSELLKAGYDTTSDQSDDLTFYKLENGRSYMWWIFTPNGQKYDWVRSDFHLPGYTLVNNKSSYCIIPVLNVDGCQSNSAVRPSNIQLPKSEEFTLEGYFNDKKVLLMGTVSFELNPGYDPNYKFSHRGSTSYLMMSVYLLLLSVMIIIFLLLKTRTKKTNRSV